jgi:hypothetical protein
MENEYGRKEEMQRYKRDKQMRDEYTVTVYGCVTIEEVWIGELIYCSFTGYTFK